MVVMAGSLLSSGCSKSKPVAPSSGSSADATAASVASDDPVEMRIHWMVGRKYPLRMELTQSTRTEMPNQAKLLIQDVKLNQDFNIAALKELDNGGRQLELRFEGEQMKVSQGDQPILRFDSAQSPAQDARDPAAPVLRAVLDARIQYFTDAGGKVEKMAGVDELTKRITATGRPQEQAMFNQMFSEDTLKRYGSFGEAMPGHAVKIGDSWRLRKDMPSPIGILALNLKYTFQNWEQFGDRKCAHVEAEGELSSKSISAATGMMVEITKGKISGEFWYDPALGMIVETHNDLDLTLKITTRAQSMTSQFSQKTRLALVDGPQHF